MKEENNELRDWFLNEIAKIDITGNKQNQNVKWQDKWQKLKEWLDRVFQIYLNESDHKMMSIYGTILDKMRELEGEDE